MVFCVCSSFSFASCCCSCAFASASCGVWLCPQTSCHETRKKEKKNGKATGTEFVIHQKRSSKRTGRGEAGSGKCEVKKGKTRDKRTQEGRCTTKRLSSFLLLLRDLWLWWKMSGTGATMGGGVRSYLWLWGIGRGNDSTCASKCPAIKHTRAHMHTRMHKQNTCRLLSRQRTLREEKGKPQPPETQTKNTKNNSENTLIATHRQKQSWPMLVGWVRPNPLTPCAWQHHVFT